MNQQKFSLSSGERYSEALDIADVWTRRLLTIADKQGVEEMLVYMRSFVRCADSGAIHAPRAGMAAGAVQ